MSRKVNIVVLLVAAMLLAVGAYTQAQVRGSRGPRQRPSRQQGPSLAEAAAKLKLTESKQRQVHQILSAQQSLRDQAAGERDKLTQEMQEARVAGDNERLGELRSELWRRRRGGPVGRQQALEGFKKVLTEQQYAQLEEILSGPARAEKVARFLRELQSVGLSIKQEAAVDKIMADAMERIRRSLTVEQRENLSAAIERPERRFGVGGQPDTMRQRWQQLSDEQREELAEMHEELWEKLADAETPEERREIRQEIRSKMREIFQRGREEPEGEETSEEQPSEERTDQ